MATYAYLINILTLYDVNVSLNGLIWDLSKYIGYVILVTSFRWN